MYNIMSPKAEEFISHEEILDCLEYGQKNKTNRELIDKILTKARERKGLSHREAIVLLDCELEDKNQEIYELAGETFNIASPKQVGEVLFDKLRIIEKAKKTKTGQYVTSEEVLESPVSNISHSIW